MRVCVPCNTHTHGEVDGWENGTKERPRRGEDAIRKPEGKIAFMCDKLTMTNAILMSKWD